MRNLLIVFLIILFVASAYGQAPDTVWTRTYGGADRETVECASALPNDYYAIGGYSISYGVIDDAYVVKLDINGDTVFTGTYGAASYDYLEGFVEAHDGDLVVGGRHAYSVGANRKAWIFKLDDNGDIVWETEFAGADDLEASAIAPSADSGFILTGYTNTGSSNDFWVIKADRNGDSLWFNSFGAPGDDRPTGIIPTGTDSYMIVGTTRSFGGSDPDVWVVGINGSGDSLWSQVFGNTSNELDPVVCAADDGSFLIATSSINPATSNYDPFLIKIQADGDSVWTRFIDFGVSISTRAVSQARDHGILIGGSINIGFPLGNQMWLGKIDAALDTVWTTSVGGDGTDRALCVHEASNRQIMLLGQWYSSTSFGECYAAKFLPSILSVDEYGNILPESFTLDQNYPNPFNPDTRIMYTLERRSDVSIAIFNSLGQRVRTLVEGSVAAGEHTAIWDGKDDRGTKLASGVYFYRMTTDGVAQSRKMVLLK